jgi:protoporphyrinogen oxidase
MDVTRIVASPDKISAVEAIDTQNGQSAVFEGDYFFSTMPVRDLIAGIGKDVPADVAEIAGGLQYRDFITVGLLVKKLIPSPQNGNRQQLISDNWIYIQEKDVKVGRLQIFNNWSPFMVKDPDTVWLGLEYFCNQNDLFWQMDDAKLANLAIDELVKIEIIDRNDVLDHTVIRVEKTYPAYFGTYNRFDLIREYADRFQNLFLIGRNGMHKYNNADHSMLSAMTAVDNIIANKSSKENIWNINTEQDYQE